MRLYNMLGYKLFKEKEDGSLHVVRIVHIRKPFKITSSTKDPDEMTIFDKAYLSLTPEQRKFRVNIIKRNYDNNFYLNNRQIKTDMSLFCQCLI